MEYFYGRTAHLLRLYDPSPLWNVLIDDLIPTEPLLLNIAVAIGRQHRDVDDGIESRSEQASIAYSTALATFQHSLEESDRNSINVMACLLLTVLETLRGSPKDFVIHLQTGMRLVRGRTPCASDSTYLLECIRLLKNYSVVGAIFNPTSDEAFVLHELLREVLAEEAADDPHGLIQQGWETDLWRLTSDLLSLLTLTFLIPGADLAMRFEQILGGLRSRQRQLQDEIEKELVLLQAEQADDTRCIFALARCLMVKIFLTSAWSGRQTSFDDELGTFRRIVTLEEQSLLQARDRHSTLLAERQSSLSIGIGAMSVLSFVVFHCRDHDTRYKALELLELCPRREGPWSLQLCRSCCEAVLRFEEDKAGAIGVADGQISEIPENCRQQHYRLHHLDGIDSPAVIEFLFNPVPGSSIFVSERLALS